MGGIAKHKIYWDDKLVGLGIRITNNDAKSFVLRYVIHGRERKYTIGSYPAISYSAAKDMATQIKGEIAKGCDPLDERKMIQGIIPLPINSLKIIESNLST